MKITIITVFPEFYDSFFKHSLISRAIQNGVLSVNFIKFSDMCEPKERIDTQICGPGVGMLIKPEVVQNAIEKAENLWGQGFKIFFSPQGEKMDQILLKNLANNFLIKDSKKDEYNSKFNNNHIILVCARYEGLDQRVEDFYADLVLSVGDYVLMGGDLPAQLFIESFLRLVPGIIGKSESVEKDSFYGAFLDYPSYCLPKSWKNIDVPEVLLSGNHALIDEWRQNEAAKKTIFKRFDWFISSNPDINEIKTAKKFIPKHYVALMHSQVLVQGDKVGDTSITSLDIHDIARSSATYDIKNYFVVSGLKDQQKILNTFLDFWKSEDGKDYNFSRFQAVNRIIPALSFSDIIDKIKEIEGLEPIVITTSAKTSNLNNNGPKIIDYNSQGEIFSQKRPILFVFGTGQGLSNEILDKSDYLLLPIKGLSDYNHLSVRSAAAIILDRWLGLKNRVE
ncbi:tRNA (guanosine(37)-N1)-methyltransferase TrmD [Candidatus Dependentiae bacterium]|nr:tRNA (guanosine(37)-N1)-methyltransferase TrmD [Candidatus Dependentiae bacterium]